VFLFRRSALWLGCAILTVGFVAAEEFVSASTRAPNWLTLSPASGIPDEGDDGAEPAPPDSPPVLIIDTDVVLGKTSRPVTKTTARAALRRTYRVTAYCDRGTTAAGVPSGSGQCAAPANIPFGSKVYIPALGRTFVVTDRTHRRFRHNTVDLFLSSEDECRQFGRRYLECHILVPENPPQYGQVRVPTDRS